MADNKQTVLADEEILRLRVGVGAGDVAFGRRIESAVLSKLRAAGEPIGVVSAQECDAVPYVHPEFGPGIFFTEDCRIAAPQASAEGDIQAKLKDPNVVHVNMLRGTIAPITFDQLAHVLGDEATAKWIADRQQRGGYALHNLVAEKFASGNSIPVERITITRAEFDAAIAQQRQEGA